MPKLATGIDRDPDRQGGEPCVVGTRVPVRRIGHLVDRHGADPSEAAERYGISRSDVYRALAYYYDHPDEMERHDRRDSDREQRSAEAEDGTTDVETFEEAYGRLEKGP